MEEKLDLIIQKLDELLVLAEPSIENNASEYLLNVLGDVLMQGFTGSSW